MNSLLKLVGLALLVWFVAFYALEVIATAMDPYHSSGGTILLSTIFTAVVGWWFVARSPKHR